MTNLFLFLKQFSNTDSCVRSIDTLDEKGFNP